jgi:predicted RNase H-like HicB family nuclease
MKKLLKNGLEVIKLWIEAAEKDDRPVPQPMVTA